MKCVTGQTLRVMKAISVHHQPLLYPSSRGKQMASFFMAIYCNSMVFHSSFVLPLKSLNSSLKKKLKEQFWPADKKRFAKAS